MTIIFNNLEIEKRFFKLLKLKQLVTCIIDKSLLYNVAPTCTFFKDLLMISISTSGDIICRIDMYVDLHVKMQAYSPFGTELQLEQNQVPFVSFNFKHFM